jgi:hypothetical protein
MRQGLRKSSVQVRRVGFGEYADPRGIIPLLIGRLQYLEALATECPEAVEQLKPIWSSAMAAFARHHAAVEELAAEHQIEPVPAFDERWAAAVMAPLVEVFGFPLDELANEPVSAQPHYPSLPSDSPVMVALTAEFELILRRLGHWMRRWGLPDRDIGWCFIVICWSFVAMGQRVWEPIDAMAPLDATSTDDPPMGLLDPVQIKTVFEKATPFLADLPKQGDPVALGEWLANIIDSAIGRAQPIELPAMSWHPRIEPRAVAEARLVAEAKRLIKEQIDATDMEFAIAGARRTPVKTTGLEHYRWLVLHQVRGKSQRSIAKEVFLTREAVRNALADTAELIGLPLRPNEKFGRPPKNKRQAA